MKLRAHFGNSEDKEITEEDLCEVKTSALRTAELAVRGVRKAIPPPRGGGGTQGISGSML